MTKNTKTESEITAETVPTPAAAPVPHALLITISDGRAFGWAELNRQDELPSKILLPPGRWRVGETTVKLDAAEYICLGSPACGTCRKCLETKPETSDKKRG